MNNQEDVIDIAFQQIELIMSLLFLSLIYIYYFKDDSILYSIFISDTDTIEPSINDVLDLNEDDIEEIEDSWPRDEQLFD